MGQARYVGTLLLCKSCLVSVRTYNYMVFFQNSDVALGARYALARTRHAYYTFRVVVVEFVGCLSIPSHVNSTSKINPRSAAKVTHYTSEFVPKLYSSHYYYCCSVPHCPSVPTKCFFLSTTYQYRTCKGDERVFFSLFLFLPHAGILGVGWLAHPPGNIASGAPDPASPLQAYPNELGVFPPEAVFFSVLASCLEVLVARTPDCILSPRPCAVCGTNYPCVRVVETARYTLKITAKHAAVLTVTIIIDCGFFS